MIRLPTLIWLLLMSAAGFAMFAVKYEVQSVADRVAHTQRQAEDTDRTIRALSAEWAYLNRPDALAQMNQRFLSLAPIATKQLRANIADVPMRPAPPPVPAPVDTIATGAAPQMAAAEPPTFASSTPPETVAQQKSAPPAASADPAKPVLTAAVEPQTALRSAKPAATKLAFRPAASHRAASLNELIAQIAESH